MVGYVGMVWFLTSAHVFMLQRHVLRATGLVECLLYLDYHKRPTTVQVNPEGRMTVGSLSMADLNIMVLA